MATREEERFDRLWKELNKINIRLARLENDMCWNKNIFRWIIVGLAVMIGLEIPAWL